MIKKLQRKFVMIAMISLGLVMVLLVGLINIIYLNQMNSKINSTIQILSENEGKFPMFERKEPPKSWPNYGFEMNPETQFETRYFVVEVNNDGEVETTNTGHIKAITSEEAGEYAENVMSSNKKSGFEGIYKYAVVEQTDGYMVIFVDCRNQIQTATLLLVTSIGVAFITLLLMFILVSVFSKKAIKPFIVNMEKQKQFITDAGHEIKTPLAIISANADVLELTGGESEWITSIRNQTSRLDKLVKNLLMLSKMDEANIKLIFTDFDLSETVRKTAASFHSIAETTKKNYVLDIHRNIKLHGDESSIQQLVSTLVDNAMKYSDEEGTIRVSLTTSKKRAKLEVYNTTKEIKVDQLDQLFDRFYRADSSRSRETGGYGIGLSITKSIVEAHHGKITVKSEDGKSICFTVLI